MSQLQPITPEEAFEMYLEGKRTDAAESTVREHRYRLKHFVAWCDQNEVSNLNDLSGRDLYAFRQWRKDDGDLNKLSLRNNLSCLRSFLRFCEQIDAVEKDLYEKVDLPAVSGEQASKDASLSPERAKQIRTFLSKYQYATREHTIFELLWHTGIRIGTARSLDIADFEYEDRRLRIRHRPEEGTPLKNGHKAERQIALNDEVATIIKDWIDTNRPEATDGHGRRPLFASEYGRAHNTTLRRTIYRCSQPCYYGGEVPESCEETDCHASGYDGGSRCSASVEPHAIRRGAITHFLSEDVPETVVSDRMNVSKKVLDQHYDARSEEQKSEQRRQYLEDV